jgi:hypothetical protein
VLKAMCNYVQSRTGILHFHSGSLNYIRCRCSGFSFKLLKTLQPKMSCLRKVQHTRKFRGLLMLLASKSVQFPDGIGWFAFSWYRGTRSPWQRLHLHSVALHKPLSVGNYLALKSRVLIARWPQLLKDNPPRMAVN